MADQALLDKLAESVSDGDVVDWEKAEASAASEQDRAIVRNLRLVSDISRHGTGELAEDPSEAPTRTLVAHEAAADTLGTWGHLKLREKIGEGGFAEVYKAWDAKLEREVALKLLRPSAPGHADVATSILDEGRLLARVQHPNVVTVHGAEEHDGRVGIWMELINGQTLEQLLKTKKKLGAREAADIGRDVCSALAAVHRASLVHSDIKTSNVMQAVGGRNVLMDFNTGRDAASESRHISGTPLYMPPEAFRGQSTTVRGDIYGVGVLLYHLVSGSYPVRADNLQELRAAHERGESKLLRDEEPGLDEGFLKIVERALARDPAERFATAGKMQQALSQYLGVEAIDHDEKKDRRRLWIPLAAAASILLAAVSVWMINQGISIPDGGRTGSIPPTVQNGSDSAAADPISSPGPGTDGLENPGAPSLGSYSVEAALYRHAETPERLVPGARVSVGDEVYMDFSASEELFVYVMAHDMKGRTFVLFPQPSCNLTNPLGPGMHRLPCKQTNWQFDTVGEREQILAIASPRQLEEVERTMRNIPPGQLYAELQRGDAMTLRGLGGLKIRPEGGADTAGTRLFEDVKRVADSAENVSGLWMRQIDLENPPTP